MILHCLVISVKLGWLFGILMSFARFSEEQSNKNCVRISVLVLVRILLVGKYLATVFSTSGKYLWRVSIVDLHLARRCSRSSGGAGR